MRISGPHYDALEFHLEQSIWTMFKEARVIFGNVLNLKLQEQNLVLQLA